MNVYLLRHPMPDIPKGVCYGRLDVPLAPGWESLISSKSLPAEIPDLVFSSPAQRCHRVARHLHEFHGWPEAQLEPLLQELDFGEWEGRPWEEIARSELDPWGADFVNVSAGGGESYLALSERCRTWMKQISKMEAETVFAITHAGFIRAFLSLCQDISLDKSFHFEIEYLGLVQVNLY